MTHVLAVSHPSKGGTGKSASVLHLSGALARTLSPNGDPAVLVGDFDYGSTVTAGLGVPDDFPGPSIADVILGRRTIEDVILTETTVPGLHLLPGVPDMEDLETEVSHRPDATFSRHLQRIAGRYQVALLDTHPSVGPYTRQALAAATGLLLPVMPSPESVRATRSGIMKLQGWASSMDIPIVGVVIWAVARGTRVHRELEATVRGAFGDLVFSTAVRRAATHEQAWEATQDVLGYAPTSELAGDVAELTAELIGRLNALSAPAGAAGANP